jgi:predicted TPR repeat methyltransferase
VLKKDLCRGEILVLGCGTGLLLDYVQKKADDYFGIDISTNMLNEMRAKHSQAHIEKMDIKDISTRLKGQH